MLHVPAVAGPGVSRWCQTSACTATAAGHEGARDPFGRVCCPPGASLRRPSHAQRDATGARNLGAVCVDQCPVQMQKASWDAPREEGAREEEGWAVLCCVAAACRMRREASDINKVNLLFRPCFGSFRISRPAPALPLAHRGPGADVSRTVEYTGRGQRDIDKS